MTQICQRDQKRLEFHKVESLFPSSRIAQEESNSPSLLALACHFHHEGEVQLMFARNSSTLEIHVLPGKYDVAFQAMIDTQSVPGASSTLAGG